MEQPNGDACFSTVDMLPSHADVIIAGGGVTGASLAAGLGDQGYRVVVLEPNPNHCNRLAGELIHPRGVEILQSLGLMRALWLRGGVPVDGFAVYPAPNEGEVCRLQYHEAESNWTPGLGIHHETLVRTLRAESAARPGVTYIRAKCCELMADGHRVVGVVANDQNGRVFRLKSTVVVGADGRQSTVRKLLRLSPEKERVSFSCGADLPLSALPVSNCGHIFLGGWGPVLAYPVGTQHARTIFDLPPDFSEGRKDRLSSYLEKNYLEFLPLQFRSHVKTAIHDYAGLQIAPNYRMRAERVWDKGVVLVGDACGCMHPMTAAGITNGLHDVATLLPLLRRYIDSGGQDQAALGTYEARRKPFFATRYLLARALWEVFRSDAPGAQALRMHVFRRWRTHPRFRRRTLGLLSGSETRPWAFATQYLSVVRDAALGTANDGTDTSAAILRDIARQSITHLDRRALLASIFGFTRNIRFPMD
ncbi:MAG: FAD-dependent monooxygenase [Myxococcales bacterium]|nr:FAD-dependent monooxygenase [Myxococcales bacterium]